MINRVVLVGRITKDPELRKTASGISVVSFTLACNRRFSSGQEGNQEADFISCVAWRNSADFMTNYVKQGALLGVEGRLQTRNYKDQNDRTVYVTEVVCDSVQLIANKRDNPQQMASSAPTANSYGNYDSDFVSDTLDIASDDLPF